MNEIYETEEFSRVCGSLEKFEQDWIEKIKDQLVENLNVGKPLRFDWFREKKLGSKRLFYLINVSSKKAILIAYGTKKEQQSIINHIIINKERYSNCEILLNICSQLLISKCEVK
ncbi:hypothetical protein J4437_04040 [Candidatus Woesearchaeota archaeon]|nr:hypothetical protein [uncultured archaeon]MBS3123781.1 hypothetical protein [Candidatus Woesearchaeota archaeon]